MKPPVNIIDELPEPHRGTFTSVLEKHDPELLRTLRSSSMPTIDAWQAVEEIFIDALSEHYGPGHEPDEIGKGIDNALGVFMTRWPIDTLAGPGG